MRTWTASTSAAFLVIAHTTVNATPGLPFSLVPASHPSGPSRSPYTSLLRVSPTPDASGLVAHSTPPPQLKAADSALLKDAISIANTPGSAGARRRAGSKTLQDDLELHENGVTTCNAAHALMARGCQLKAQESAISAHKAAVGQALSAKARNEARTASDPEAKARLEKDADGFRTLARHHVKQAATFKESSDKMGVWARTRAYQVGRHRLRVGEIGGKLEQEKRAEASKLRVDSKKAKEGGGKMRAAADRLDGEGKTYRKRVEQAQGTQ